MLQYNKGEDEYCVDELPTLTEPDWFKKLYDEMISNSIPLEADIVDIVNNNFNELI